MSLRKKIADSERFNRTVAAILARYVRFVFRTSSWRREGFEPLDALVKAGEPVIVVLWHQRLTMSPYLFPIDLGPICTITSAARAGTMAGRVQSWFGMGTIAMMSRQRHVALSREVLRQMKAGVSIGIAADGPRGPERIMTTVPLVWARTSGKRIFAVSYATRNGAEANTWDHLHLPRPFTKGVLKCREWTTEVPRKASPEQLEELRLELQSFLNNITEECDTEMGRAPFEYPG